MFLLKFTLFALALAKGGSRRSRRRSGGHHRDSNDDGASSNPCHGLSTETKQDLLEGMLKAFDDAETDLTLYCQLDAKYDEWPGCPVEDEEDEGGEDEGTVDIGGLRRNLGENQGGSGHRNNYYNSARFEMTTGTTSWMQVKTRSEDADDAFTCYENDELQLTFDNIVMDWKSTARRSLGADKVEATMTMTQTSTTDADCPSISHELTCSIPRHGGLTAVDETTCGAKKVECYSDLITIRCYTEAEKADRGFSEATSCPDTEGTVTLGGN